MIGVINQTKLERVIQKAILLFLILIVTAAAYCGFFTKWAFRDDGGPNFGIAYMIDGTAKRPFVYRRLVPETAKFITNALPVSVRERLSNQLEKKQSIEIFGRFNHRASRLQFAQAPIDE